MLPHGIYTGMLLGTQRNASSSAEGATEDLAVMDARLLQPYNAYLPIEVTELGMVTAARLSQPKNAAFPIEVTELGIAVF